jgi:hypothetical protein
VEYDPPPLGAVTMANAPRAPRVELRDAAVAKVGALADAFGVGPRWLRWLTRPVLRWSVKRAVRSKLNGLLEL